MSCTATGWRRQVCSGRFGLPGQKVFHSPGTPITVTNRNPIRRYSSARCRVAHWHVRNKPKPPHAQQQSITLMHFGDIQLNISLQFRTIGSRRAMDKFAFASPTKLCNGRRDDPSEGAVCQQ
jgi:hypothetical protein